MVVIATKGLFGFYFFGTLMRIKILGIVVNKNVVEV